VLAWRILGTAVVVLVLAASSTLASTHYVVPDGTGDFPTIQAAIDSTVDGDVVLLGSGVFFGNGNRNITFGGKAITVRSSTGEPSDCIIDSHGYGDVSRGFVFDSGEGADSVLEGVTIANATSLGGVGGGVLCSSSPTITNCIIESCVARVGGGIACTGSECSPTITGCEFLHNRAEESQPSNSYGGGAYCYTSATPFFDNCVFRGNSSESWAGGIFTYYADPTFEGCLIAENTNASGTEAAIRAGTSATFRNCTIALHTGTYPCVTVGSDADVVFHNSIVAFNEAAFGEAPFSGVATLSCCDVYGNEQGDWIDGLAAQLGVRGNICEDPLFCDISSYDFELEEGSPCAPNSTPNPSCDLIGAYGVGCPSSTAVTEMSWGAIKALMAGSAAPSN
jgi:hypothetical protein